MKDFEDLLQDCLDALAEGRWDVDECLRRYPEHADGLRPHLLVAMSFRAAFEAEPREEFEKAARERFLIATGRPLQEAYDVEPSPSFFAAARVKFLMTAHRMKLGQRSHAPRSLPLFGTPFRALATATAALAIFMGASTYTVASSSAAVPGDWQYPVKLQTERVRLALALSADAKQDVRINIANERTKEIEKLSASGREIGPAVLDRLVNHTKPLIDAADAGTLDPGEVEKLNAVTARQQNALGQAKPKIAPGAQAQFDAAVSVSQHGYRVTYKQLVEGQDRPLVTTPSVPLARPTPVDTPEPAETPTTPPESTPGDAASPTAEATPSATPGLVIDPELVDSSFGVMWTRLVTGPMTVLIPSEKDGWRLIGINRAQGSSGPAPVLVRLSNAEGTSLITLNPRNGDMYWFILRNGRFDEVQMRMTRDGGTLIIDAGALRAAYGAAADVPLYILEHIEIAPPPEE